VVFAVDFVLELDEEVLFLEELARLELIMQLGEWVGSGY
jgi:hypothetical protein